MRCDGVVEYSYETNGIRVYGPDASWDISYNDTNTQNLHGANRITPKKQAQRYMTRVLKP